MKRFLSLFLALGLILGVTACGSNDSKDDKESEKSSKKEYVDEKDISKVYSNPDKYKGKYIKLTGKVFMPPEKDDDGVYFQMWEDPENNDHNTVVGYESKDFDVKEGDFVAIDGKIDGVFKGKNSFGGSVDALQITATSIELTSYSEVVSPTLKEVEVNQQNSQNGVDIRIDKVEFAKNETRIYYTITNNSGSKYSFYDFSLMITQNGKQFKEQANYSADYPSVSGDVLNGITADGIVAFPVLEQADFEIHFDAGHGDNYDLDFEAFTIPVTMK